MNYLNSDIIPEIGQCVKCNPDESRWRGVYMIQESYAERSIPVPVAFDKFRYKINAICVFTKPEYPDSINYTIEGYSNQFEYAGVWRTYSKEQIYHFNTFNTTRMYWSKRWT